MLIQIPEGQRQSLVLRQRVKGNQDRISIEAWCLAYTSLAVPYEEDREASTHGILARAEESAAIAPPEIADEMQTSLESTRAFFEMMVEVGYDESALTEEQWALLDPSPEEQADLDKPDHRVEERCVGTVGKPAAWMALDCVVSIGRSDCSRGSGVDAGYNPCGDRGGPAAAV